MEVAVTGATGFIGRPLTARLLERGDEVLAFSRSAERARKTLPAGAEPVEWIPGELGPWTDALNGADAVVHLAARSPDTAPDPLAGPPAGSPRHRVPRRPHRRRAAAP